MVSLVWTKLHDLQRFIFLESDFLFVVNNTLDDAFHRTAFYTLMTNGKKLLFEYQQANQNREIFNEFYLKILPVGFKMHQKIYLYLIDKIISFNYVELQYGRYGEVCKEFEFESFTAEEFFNCQGILEDLFN